MKLKCVLQNDKTLLYADEEEGTTTKEAINKKH